jgi:hypothetical protein
MLRLRILTEVINDNRQDLKPRRVNASGGEHHDHLSRLTMYKRSKSGEGQSSHVPFYKYY